MLLKGIWDGVYQIVALRPDKKGERVALYPEGAGRTQIVTLDFWT